MICGNRRRNGAVRSWEGGLYAREGEAEVTTAGQRPLVVTSAPLGLGTKINGMSH